MSTTKKDITSALMRGADSLRDTIDAANYKDYVLPIMFVKENHMEYEKFYSVYNGLYPAVKDSFSRLAKIL